MKQQFTNNPDFFKSLDTPIDVTGVYSELSVPDKVRIRTRYVEDEIFVDTSGVHWKHERYCSINWKNCKLNEPVLSAFRKYIWFRLSSASPKSAESNYRCLLEIQDILNSKTFPWSISDCENILVNSEQNRSVFFAFRLFYRWAAMKGLLGFSPDISSSLDDLAGPEFEIYRSIKLRENVLSPSDEVKLIETINEFAFEDDFFSFQDNVIAQINWELGCRAEQITGIEHHHFTEIKGANGTNFYHIKLIRMKQRSYKSSYRNRVISEQLATKIKRLILLKSTLFGEPTPEHPLFITLSKKRMKNSSIRFAILGVFEQAGLNGGSNTLLRHNMAQKLADQGTPSDLISDMLDHTTKIAARFYVAATPEIGRIKSRALGKNSTYISLMSLMTGSPISHDQIKDRSQIIKGVIATRYIGNIGICGLDKDTECNKNPIYSCYTCRKFNPFVNGEHGEVVDALRTEVQVLLDQSANLTENKVILQLEKTIEHAEFTREICIKAARGQSSGT